MVRHSERGLRWAGPTSSHSAWWCRPVNPFQQEADKASTGRPSSESSAHPDEGEAAFPRWAQQRFQLPAETHRDSQGWVGASDELAHLVKRERQSLVHSGLDLASQRVRLEDELGADGEAGEEQGRGLQLLFWAVVPGRSPGTLQADRA